jgi:cytochrome b561
MRAVNDRHAERYPLVLRVLHWLLAGLLAVQLALGFAMEHWTPDAVSANLLPLHFRLGMLVLCLMLLRLWLRLALPMPRHEEHASRWHHRARPWVHAGLYLLVLVLPVSGHVIWVWMGADRTLFAGLAVPALFVPPDNETGRALAWYVHVYGAWTLMALASLHAAAAVVRQWRRRDDFIARRMGFACMRRPRALAIAEPPDA